ncbi:MAG TPA: DUF11 domain-containing protein [Solirubrobacteraceae bacterium]|jgi:hypothetical protein|nr:DUF11 domain-containing protein [Solirubrobacteraceae bacterium]
MRGILGVGAVVCAIALGVPALAGAATFDVTSPQDAPLAASPPGTNPCESTLESGDCTLRSAIQAAGASNDSSNTISVPAGTYDLTLPQDDDDPDFSGAVGSLDIGNNMTIQGAGAGSTIIDGGGPGGTMLDRDFLIEGGPDGSWTVAINGVTIEGGDAQPEDLSDIDVYIPALADGDGGGVLNIDSALTMNGDVITDNTAADDGGGVVDSYVAEDCADIGDIAKADDRQCAETEPRQASDASTVITDSTISDNDAAYAGGGYDAESGGTVTLEDDTISGNGTAVEGAGFADTGGDDDTLTNDTIVDNTITQDAEPDFITGGAGVEFAGGDGTDDVAFDTFAGNTVVDPDPQEPDDQTVNIGVESDVDDALTAHQLPEGWTVDLKNSILLGGASDGPNYNCDPDTITDQGGNLFNDSGSECGAGTGISDVINSDPLLGPLAVSVGSTATEVPANSSPAVDALTPANCTDANGTVVTSDQRGVTRPQGSACDIGAVEVQQADMAVTSSASPASIAVGGQSTVTDTVTDNGQSAGTNVVLSDPAAGYTIVSASSSQGTCAHTSTTVTCDLGTVDVGGHAVVRIVVSGTSAGTVEANATVSADQKDPSPANNTAQIPLAITPALTVTATTHAAAAVACASLRNFTIHVQNARKLRLVSAVVRVAGRRYRLHKGHFSARVNLTGLPFTTFVVKITAHTKRGKVLHAKRTYHTCRLTPLPGHKFLLL